MNTNHPPHPPHNHNPNLDPSLRAIEDALESLGAAERARAHGALEQDILRASRGALRGGTTAHSDTPSALTRIFGIGSPARLAAGVALAATIGLIAFVAIRSSTTTARQFAQAERDLDSFLTTGDAPGDTDTTLILGDADLVDLKASIAAAEQSLDDFWTVPDDDSDPLGSDLENSL